MDNSKKALKVIAALVVVFTLSGFGTSLNKSQKAQVVSVVPTSVFSSFNRNDKVLRAQTILKDLGMYSGRLSGLFGFKTRNAILNYQISVGIPRTGILDILTQNRLFAPPPVTYTLVNNNSYGNQFLSEWVDYMYANTGDEVILEGLLTDQGAEISHNGRSGKTNNTLISGSTEYMVLNITEWNLNDYANLDVRITGYIFENENDSTRPILVTSYIPENILEDEYPLVRYTREGNNNLHDFVTRQHNELGNYVNIRGYFSIQSDYMSYDGASTPTRIQLTGIDNKYAVENISGSNLEEIGEVNVTVRGFLLDGINDHGLPTIVVNYISPDEGLVVVGHTAEGDVDLHNWILDVYREEGVYTRLVGTVSDTGHTVIYAPGGDKSSIVIDTESGERFTVDNIISGDNINEFIGQEVVVYGFVLQNLNAFRLRTIAINHIE